MLLHDFPREIKRSKQMAKLKEAKKKDLKVSPSKSEPEKLLNGGKLIKI